MGWWGCLVWGIVGWASIEIWHDTPTTIFIFGAMVIAYLDGRLDGERDWRP